MRRVVFLAYHFPPIGGAGVQRSAKFARYLGDEGYASLVVTGPGAVGGRWTPGDEDLVRDVPAEVEVVRVPGPVPAESDGWRGRAERWLGLEPPFAAWWIDGAVAAAQDRDADVILASMSPFESAKAAARLARRLGRPWVADLRDPWALDEMHVYPSRWHRAAALRRMRRVLATADAVVMNTPEAAARLKAFPEFAGRLVVSITNGFDPGDFEGDAPRRDDDAFRIVHTGYLHTELGRRHRSKRWARRLLGGAVPGVDILSRSHVYLLQAMDSLSARRPDLADRIELHLAGVLSDVDLDAAGSRRVRIHGYLPHTQTTALMRSADLLFLPMHDLPPGMRATIVPGKTYEYLAAGRPILAAVPQGDARDILAASGVATLCDPSDAAGLSHALEVAVDRWIAGAPVPTADDAVVRSFDRRQLTASLARVLDEMVVETGSPRSPAAVVGVA